jgi:hypothetical protein
LSTTGGVCAKVSTGLMISYLMKLIHNSLWSEQLCLRSLEIRQGFGAEKPPLCPCLPHRQPTARTAAAVTSCGVLVRTHLTCPIPIHPTVYIHPCCWLLLFWSNTWTPQV